MSLGNSCQCSCKNNYLEEEPTPIPTSASDQPTDQPAETNPTLVFEKLAYDRDHERLIIMLKNTGKEAAKNVTLRCSNMSADEESRKEVLFDSELVTDIVISDIPANSSTAELYVNVDFQDAKEALVKVEEVSAHKIERSIQIYRWPIDLFNIEPDWMISDEQGYMRSKLKLWIYPNTNVDEIDFNRVNLIIKPTLSGLGFIKLNEASLIFFRYIACIKSF